MTYERPSSLGRTAAAVVVLVLLSVSLSGCLWTVLGGSCGRSGSAVWTEPGLFDRFPEENSVAGYRIVWHIGGDLKSATARNGSLGSLKVEHDDRTVWFNSADEDLSDEATRLEVARTFEDLSLGQPHLDDARISWGEAAC